MSGMTSRPAPGEERYFAMFDIEEAIAWAKDGGIAVHQNFMVDGLKIGGRVRQGRAYHVFGLREALLAWGNRNGQRAPWMQWSEDDRRVADPPHFDVFGAPARKVEARLGIPTSEAAIGA